MKKEDFAFSESKDCNPNRLIVDLSAIGKNVERLKQYLPPRMRMMAILKANAYGTNYAVLGNYLKEAGIDIVGAANLIEALFFKKIGIQQEIFILHTYPPEAAWVVENGFVVAVDDADLIEALQTEAKKQQKILKVHLKVETGMGRFGCTPKEAVELSSMIKQSDHLFLEGLSTHFSCADREEKEDFTYEQYTAFCKVLRLLRNEGIDPIYRHAANSSGAIRFDLPECNMVRIGLALYGIEPDQRSKELVALEPCLSLLSRIVKISTYEKGHPIGYGSTYMVQRDKEKIAVIPIGYFDGIHQQYREASFLIHGKKAPIVGKICMDYIMCDVTDIPEAKMGDEVLIFGKDSYGNEISPQFFADLGGCDVRQFICCLGPRIKRVLRSERRPVVSSAV